MERTGNFYTSQEDSQTVKETRVVTLYRVSTKKQINFSEDHQSDIPMQKDACHAFVKSMAGWKIVKEFEEKGISGFKISAKDRDAIIELQEAALNKEFDVLLVYMFDRIGRIDDETPFIVEWFVKTAGVSVWSVQEGQQRFENHVDKLMNYIRFWQASGESQKTSMRIRTRMEQLKLMGIYTGGPLQYGYRLAPSNVLNRKGKMLKRYEIDMEQYIVVRKIVEKTINNGIGSWRIAKLLDEQGYETNNGSKFTSTAVLQILRSSMLRGMTNKGETSEALQGLKMISEDEAERIDYILEQRGKTYDEKRRISRMVKGEALLSGNIFCAHCGGRIGVRHHKDIYKKKDGSISVKDELKYYCYNKSRKLCECESQTNYIASKIDAAVTEVMRKIFENMDGAPEEERFKKILDKQRKVNEAGKKKAIRESEKYKKQLEVLQMEIGLSLTGNSIYSPEDLKDAINTTKLRIIENEEKIKVFETELEEQNKIVKAVIPSYRKFKSWAEEFESAGTEQRTMIASQLFDKIELGVGYKLYIEVNATYKQFCSSVDNGDDKIAG